MLDSCNFVLESCSLLKTYRCFLPTVYKLLVLHPSKFQNQEEEPEGNFPNRSKKDRQLNL